MRRPPMCVLLLLLLLTGVVVCAPLPARTSALERMFDRMDAADKTPPTHRITFTARAHHTNAVKTPPNLITNAAPPPRKSALERMFEKIDAADKKRQLAVRAHAHPNRDKEEDAGKGDGPELPKLDDGEKYDENVWVPWLDSEDVPEEDKKYKQRPQRVGKCKCTHGVVVDTALCPLESPSYGAMDIDSREVVVDKSPGSEKKEYSLFEYCSHCDPGYSLYDQLDTERLTPILTQPQDPVLPPQPAPPHPPDASRAYDPDLIPRAGAQLICEHGHDCPRLCKLNAVSKKTIDQASSDILKVKFVDLGNQGLADSDITKLAGSIKDSQTLQDMQLRSNRIGPTGVKDLIAAINPTVDPSCKTLKYLRLADNRVGDAGVNSLAEVIKSSNSLQYLDLDGNGITTAGALVLADAIKETKTLRVLYVANNKIGDEGAQKLIDAVDETAHFKLLFVGENGLSEAKIDQIRKYTTTGSLRKGLSILA